MRDLAGRFRRTPLLGSLSTGTLLGLAFLSPAMGMVAWVGLVPLLLRWSFARRPHIIGLEAFLAFLVAFGISTYWAAFHPYPSAAIAGVAAVVLLALPPACVLGLSSAVRLRTSDHGGLLAFASLMLAYETLAAHVSYALPWFSLGYTQVALEPLNATASLAGGTGLTLFVLLINLAGTAAVLAAGRSDLLKITGMATGLLLISHLPGIVRTTPPQAEDGRLRVRIVQPGTDPGAWAGPVTGERLSQLTKLSDPASGEPSTRPHLVIWPETALRLESDPQSDSQIAELREHSRAWNVPVLLGAIRPAGDGASFYNSALGLSDSSLAVYDKRYMIPFVEHVPTFLRTLTASGLTISAGGVSGYLPGSSSGIVRIGGRSIGVLICFESLFPHLARSLAHAGGDVLVVLAQDGWWGSRRAAVQHLMRSRMRALETGIPIVHATVDGIGALVRPDGRIAEQTEWGVQTTRDMVVPKPTGATFFVRSGDWIDYVFWSLGILVLVPLLPGRETLRVR